MENLKRSSFYTKNIKITYNFTLLSVILLCNHELHSNSQAQANTQKESLARLQANSQVYVEVSIGELIDKWTILNIKKQQITDSEKLKNVETEWQVLNNTVQDFIRIPGIKTQTDTLQIINQKLWDIEDAIRLKEAKQDFGPEFLELARNVYITNDARCAVKRDINRLCGSRLIEEKHLPDYKQTQDKQNQISQTTEQIPTRTVADPVPTDQLINKKIDLINTAHRAITERKQIDALKALTDLINIDGNNPEGLALLGNWHYLTRNYQEACTYFLASLRQSPNNPNILLWLTHTLDILGKFDVLLPLTETLYNADPKSYKIKLLMAYLRSAQWDKAAPLIEIDKEWNGSEDVAGKTIILTLNYDVGSHGFGDALQLIRVAKRLTYDANALVIIHLQGDPRLKTLFNQCPYVVDVITDKDPIPAHDKHYTPSVAATMIDCARHPYKHALMTPYLHADQKLISYWKNQLPADGTLKVGLCWNRGMTQDYFSNSPIPCLRGIANNALAPFGQLTGVTFYNLQKATPDDIFPEGLQVKSFGPQFDREHGSFMDTAALMKNLDLVITIDTSIAHLAGGLGVPVWVMLPSGSDYRWLKNSERTMWYPTMRLFRQTSPYNWSQVLEQICSEVKKLTNI